MLPAQITSKCLYKKVPYTRITSLNGWGDIFYVANERFKKRSDMEKFIDRSIREKKLKRLKEI